METSITKLKKHNFQQQTQSVGNKTTFRRHHPQLLHVAGNYNRLPEFQCKDDSSTK